MVIDKSIIPADEHDLLHETVSGESGVFHLEGEDTEYAHALFAVFFS